MMPRTSGSSFTKWAEIGLRVAGGKGKMFDSHV